MTFDVSLFSLSNTAKQLSETVARMRSLQERLYESMEATDSFWEGESHDAFCEQYREDNERIRTVLDTLKSISEQAAIARDGYEDCEENVIELINAVNV